MVLVRTSWAEYALDIDCTLSEPAWTSLDRLALDQPIVFESFVCQRPLVVAQLFMAPISFSEFSSFCRPFIISS